MEIVVSVIVYDVCIYILDVEKNKQRRLRIYESRITKFIRPIFRNNNDDKLDVVK